jgi:RND family efflux transporter MFP subunit
MPSRPSRRRWVVGGLTVVVVAAAGVTAWATTSGSGASYRTAVVQRGAIQQMLTTTGALSPVRESDADFQVAGTVAKVRAVVGHKVVAGQTLARLDRSSLKAALTAARSSLTSSRSRLSDDQAGEVSGTASTTTPTATSTSARFDASRPSVVTAATPRPSGSPRATPGGATGSDDSAQLKRDQATVLAAQHATDMDLATAKTALATTTTACAAQLSGSTSSTSAAPSVALSCAQATAGLLHDQSVVSVDETAVDSAEQTLSNDLTAALKTLQQSQKSAASSTTSHQHSTTGTTSSQASLTTVTAADLATDQASIDQARASVATAKASLRQATLTAPIRGTVTAVTISKGDSVSGGSSASEPAIEIVGSRQDKVTVSLNDTQVRTIKLGMRARVTPDGSSRALTGRVVDIGATGTESASGAVSYPVAVDIAAPATSLVAGADAAVSITLATATDVIAVPTSAVHYQGSTAYVEVLSLGKAARHDITVSAVGAALTQVTSGLTAGQRVVLANLNAAVPSSNTTLTRRTGFGGGGGFGAGTGFGGGGFGGAGGGTSGTGGFAGR